MLSKREVSLVAALRQEQAVLAAKIAGIKAVLAAYEADHGGTGGEQGPAAAPVRPASWHERDAAILGAARTLVRNRPSGSTTPREIRKHLETLGVDLGVKTKNAVILICLKRHPEFIRLENGRWTLHESDKQEAVLVVAGHEHLAEQTALFSDDTPPDMDADEAISSDESSAAELEEGIDDAPDDVSNGAQDSGSETGAAQLRNPDEPSSVIDADAGPAAEVEPEQPVADRDL